MRGTGNSRLPLPCCPGFNRNPFGSAGAEDSKPRCSELCCLRINLDPFRTSRMQFLKRLGERQPAITSSPYAGIACSIHRDSAKLARWKIEGAGLVIHSPLLLPRALEHYQPRGIGRDSGKKTRNSFRTSG